MGPANRHFRRLMSLQSDSGRLSLESVMTGTALWLALVFLMQDAAAAASASGSRRDAAGPGGGDVDSTDADPMPMGPGSAVANHRAREGGGAAPDTPTKTPGAEAAASDRSSQPEGASRWNPSQGTFASGDFPPVAAAAFTSGSRQGTLDAAGSSAPSPGGQREATDSHEHNPSAGTLSTALSEAQDSGLSQDRAAKSAFQTQEQSAPDAIVRNLLVVVHSDEEIVSRSVEGKARTTYFATQGALKDAVIDLRDAANPLVLVDSERNLQLLALSVQNDADLVVESSNTGLKHTTLLTGAEANDLRIGVADVLDLGVLAGGTARAQILHSLFGMQSSRLQDLGGSNDLGLSSLTDFRLTAPEAPMGRQLGIDLLSTAMQDSAILLGDGNDRVQIVSGFGGLDTADPGIALLIPATDGGGRDDIQLRARALGLVDSLLNVGGGDDQVAIDTRMQEPRGAEALSGFAAGAGTPTLQRIALLDSQVVLGEGNDQLSIDGDTIGSRIDLGTGSNQLSINGQLQNSEVTLGPDSSNSISLDSTDDSLSLDLADRDRAELSLQAGAGNDRIQLPAGSVSGSVDGGEGFDTIGTEPSQAQSVSLDGAGVGRIDSLAFNGIEAISLGDQNAIVSVGTRGSLEGALSAGVGRDGIDYRTWKEAVQVDFAKGTATGILGGISGFEEARGGSGKDQLVAGAGTSRLDGGAGQDRITLDWASFSGSGDRSGGGIDIVGGKGRDTFVLAGLETIQPGTSGGDWALPILEDLALKPTRGGGIGLTDRLLWRQEGIQLDPSGGPSLSELTPAGIEGLGQPRLLPIAPLEQLLAGIGAGSAPQLAIATGENHSQLVLLGGDRSVTSIADLPSLRMSSGSLDHGSAAASMLASGVAA